jgi:hypothetical protein
MNEIDDDVSQLQDVKSEFLRIEEILFLHVCNDGCVDGQPAIEMCQPTRCNKNDEKRGLLRPYIWQPLELGNYKL